MSFWFHLLIYLNIYVVMAMSLNLVLGYGGLISLAHSAFFAIGAYAFALASLRLGWDFAPCLGLAAAAGAMASVALWLLALRLRGDFFSISSLAVQAGIYGLIYNAYDARYAVGHWGNLTNGPLGLYGFGKPYVCGYRIVTVGGYWAASALVTLVVLGLCWGLLTSPWGRLLRAIRDDSLAAASLGKGVDRCRGQMIAISAALAAISGAMYAGYIGFIDPSLASLDNAILFLCIIVLGGSGNALRGPIAGAVLVLALPEALRFLRIPGGAEANWRMLVYGLLLVILMHVRRGGIAGSYEIR